jgi:hypothetical protein
MLNQELRREDIAKQALDLGQISQDTYNRLVPPIDPTVPVVELTDHIPSIKDAVDKVYPGVVPLVENVASGVGSALGLTNGTKNAQAESVLRNPALDVPVETPVQLTSDKPQAPQTGQASEVSSGLGGLMGAYGQQKQAISKAAMAGAEQAEKEAAYQEKMFQESEKMRMDQAQIEQGRAEKLMQQEKLLEKKINGFNSKPANVAQVFANAGTGQKLLMGLSLFLGSAPNSSGQNTALKAMQASIDSDLSKAKADIGERQNAYKEMKNTFQDERQADAAARMAYLNNAQLKLNQIASQYKSPQILENAKLLNGKINEEMEKTKLQFQAASQTSPQFQAADQVTQSIMKFPKEQQKELLEAREVYDATRAAEKEIDSIYDGFDVGVGGYIPFTDSKAKLETERAKIESAIRATMRGQGTIQETEIVRLVNPFLPEPTDTASRLKIKKDQLKTLLKTKNAGQINRLKNAGIMPQEKKFSESAPVSTKGK